MNSHPVNKHEEKLRVIGTSYHIVPDKVYLFPSESIQRGSLSDLVTHEVVQ